ncbi:hypothetical protein SISNIDRAFT_458594 [Sistotremastrum niveocremeum HHB9708]|uniref:Uncharacterized protein n=1 Tax=Sistotremastrum niveocremeum HHB9708 TaxID=1314777 RepID=A0A164QGP3_9AGAM|nr:hypothetical protein SISNIDRAFT_458594 [Sistotremastrum niveocremeum HHB9708]
MTLIRARHHDSHRHGTYRDASFRSFLISMTRHCTSSVFCGTRMGSHVFGSIKVDQIASSPLTLWIALLSDSYVAEADVAIQNVIFDEILTVFTFDCIHDDPNEFPQRREAIETYTKFLHQEASMNLRVKMRVA